MTEKFWQNKSLAEFTKSEWEALCDGCGRCCLNKFEYDDSGEIFYTDAACYLLDLESCQCSNYPNRRKLVPDCVSLNAENMKEMDYMPPTCAYRLIGEGRSLPWWHYLVSGDKNTVHEAGISVRGRAISEKGLTDEQLEDRIVKWPMTSTAKRKK